jgi:uncharacterized protein
MLEKKLTETKVFRDSIHKNIEVEYQVIWDLINSDLVQRLRRIHQLGGTFMVFPTAEHSRFTHSLGVYEVVRRIVTEVEDVKNALSEREKIMVMCAGLLHDIGHGPFSHAFEDVFKLDHEVISANFIRQESSVNTILNNYGEDLADEIASIIEKTHPNRILVQLISSQVDADRMDYMLRDSYNCGVNYGTFDIERLLRSMSISDDKLVFKESGVHAIEDYIFARYHMYWQVYLHPVATSFEVILTKILARVKDLYNSGYHFETHIKALIPFLNKETITNEEYCKLDDSTLNYYFEQFRYEQDAILSELGACFTNRRLFAYIDINDNCDYLKEIDKIESDAMKRKYYFAIQESNSSFYKYYGELNTQSIIVKTKNNELKDLHQVSPLVSALIHLDDEESDKKLYYHKQYRGKINEQS